MKDDGPRVIILLPPQHQKTGAFNTASSWKLNYAPCRVRGQPQWIQTTLLSHAMIPFQISDVSQVQMVQKQLALKQQLPVFLHVHKGSITLMSGWRLKETISTYKWKLRSWGFSEIFRNWASHSAQPPVPCLHVPVIGNLHPWCQIPSKERIPVAAAQILQRLVRWDRFSSLCCSYCLVLIIPPTAPAMQTFFFFSRRVTHTLLTD